MIPPLGTARFDLPHLLYNQIMGAARGFQSGDLVYALVVEVENMVRHMDLGDEYRHLSNYVLKRWLKGTDFMLMGPKELTNGRAVTPPYPAFQWEWHVRTCHAWPHTERLELVQILEILAELRRRAQSCRFYNQAYVNVTDCMSSCWAWKKGHSRSKSVNLVLQKILAVQLATNLRPTLVWTLPKWNE